MYIYIYIYIYIYVYCRMITMIYTGSMKSSPLAYSRERL